MGHSHSLSRVDVARRRERIADMTARGVPTKEIAEILGIHERTVQRNREHGGVKHKPERRFTPEEIEWVEIMLADGCSYTEIGRTLGRHSKVIRNRWPGFGWTCDQGIEYRSMLKRLNSIKPRTS